MNIRGAEVNGTFTIAELKMISAMVRVSTSGSGFHFGGYSPPTVPGSQRLDATAATRIFDPSVSRCVHESRA